MNLNFNFLLVALFVICFGFSLLINHILLRFAETLGVRNRTQGQLRWNPEVKPSLGGISFFFIFLLAFIFSIFALEKTFAMNVKLIGILIASTVAFLMGLADDAFNTQPLLKLLTQIFCSLVVIVSGHSITIFENQLLNYGLTVLWVVGLMNSINMLDNMDGISTIVSILASTFMVVVHIALRNGGSYSTMLNLGVIGALCGFLVYNFHPSRMFMGDTGSQFLGLFLAIMGIDNCWNNNLPGEHVLTPFTHIVIVILVFLLPLVDTTTVTINRLARGNSPFVGGKDHTTHHLFFKGITEKRIAILYLIIGGGGIVLAYHLTIHFSHTLLYASIVYAAVVFLGLYLNTVIRRR